MPSKPRKPCNHPGCRNLTTERYCEEHRHLQAEQERERHRYYDTHQRDKRAAAFYKSVAWRRLREQALHKTHGLCAHCLEKKRIVPADMVHHQKPVKSHWELRLRLDNLIPLCNSCHSKIDHSKLG